MDKIAFLAQELEKVASKAKLLKYLKMSGESGKGALDSLMGLSRSAGSMGGTIVEGGGELVQGLGKLMQSYPQAVVPVAGTGYLAKKFLFDKQPTSSQYYYPQGY